MISVIIILHMSQIFNPLLEILHCIDYQTLYSYIDSFVQVATIILKALW